MAGPCKDCGRREVNCHSTCTDYISWKEKKVKEIAYQKAMRERAYYCIVGHPNQLSFK